MEYQIYKSKYTGKHVDDAIDQIPNKLDKQTAQTESDQVYGKLADGSQTMFDVTMGATATTIPRRDTAGRIQVADGVSGNDAVNFNQLSAQKEALEAELNKKQATLVSGTNIKTVNGNSLLGSGDLTIAGGGGDVTAAGSNIFTGLNSFRLNTTFGGTGESASDPVITVDSGAIRFRYNGLFDCGQLVTDNANDKNLTYKYNDAVVKFPKKSGTIAITDDLPVANPTAEGTVALTKLKIGDTVYNLPSGGGGDVTLAGNNTFTGTNTFKTETSVSLLRTLINQNGVSVGGGPKSTGSIVADTTYGYNNIKCLNGPNTYTYTFPNKSGTFALTSDVKGDVTAAGNNTFTGTNTFETEFQSSLYRTIIDKNGVSVGSGPSSGILVSTTYDYNRINYTNSGTTYMYYFPSANGTFALTSDIPDISNFVTLSDAQTISGNKTFNNHISLHYGPDGYIDFGSNWKFFGYSLNNGTGTSLSFPSGKNGTIALTDDIPIKSATLSDNDTTLTLVLK